MDITSCKMPTTSCTVPTNSDGATLRNSNSDAALVGALAHSAGVDNNNVKMNVHVMRVGIGFVRDSTNSFVEERAIGRKERELVGSTTLGFEYLKENGRKWSKYLHVLVSWAGEGIKETAFFPTTKINVDISFE